MWPPILWRVRMLIPTPHWRGNSMRYLHAWPLSRPVRQPNRKLQVIDCLSKGLQRKQQSRLASRDCCLRLLYYARQGGPPCEAVDGMELAPVDAIGTGIAA